MLYFSSEKECFLLGRGGGFMVIFSGGDFYRGDFNRGDFFRDDFSAYQFLKFYLASRFPNRLSKNLRHKFLPGFLRSFLMTEVFSVIACEHFEQFHLPQIYL